MLTVFTAIKVIALASYLVLALLTLRSAARGRVRVFFSIYLFGMLVWQAGSVLVNFTPRPAEALLLYNILIASSGAYTILFFPLTRALLDIRGQRFLTGLAYAACVAQFLSASLGFQLHAVAMGRGGYWVPVYDDPLLAALSSLSFLFWGLGIVNLVRGFRRERSPVQRNRIMYILIGAAVTIVGASTNLSSLRDYPVDISANLASAIIIGYAVVRHRLMDIRFVLVRSLFYSALTASLIAAYLGFILGLESLLKPTIGYSGSAYGIFAIAILAILFLPLRNLLQALLDRLFFREKGDYQKATQAFSRSIASLYDSEAIIGLAGDTIDGTVRPTFVAVSLVDARQGTCSARRVWGKEAPEPRAFAQDPDSPLLKWLRRDGRILLREEALVDPQVAPLLADLSSPFRDEAVALVAPIILNQRLLGLLILGPKLSGTMFNDEDRSFLATIANQAATGLDKSEIFLGIRRRLSEQTLLFILSEKFRGSTDFDTVMASIVQVLRTFLDCEECALVYFDRSGKSRVYAQDPVSREVAEAAGADRAWIEAEAPRLPLDGRRLLERLACLVPAVPETERAPLACLPLVDGATTYGLLIITDRGASERDERERELFQTIRAIIVQGIALYRTIVNLTSVESYNEKILKSIDDMGDILLIVDSVGVVKRANAAATRLLEYGEGGLVGRPFGLVAADELLAGQGLGELLRIGPVSNREVIFRTRSGTQVPMLFSGSILAGGEGEGQEVIVIARDMRERRKAEEAAKNKLLVQEIHHRIKNNLQVISSLLFLQAGYVGDPAVKEMFKESQNRIRSMALIHEKLYRSPTPFAIDFSDYINDLVRNLLSSYSLRPARVGLAIDVGGISLGMDSAVPCGLIINELVANSLKHAFPDDRKGSISIAMRALPPPAGTEPLPGYELVVSDDGIGFPEGVDFRSLNSLGLKIVGALTHQLHGEVDMVRDSGTRFVIRFREIPSSSMGPAPG